MPLFCEMHFWCWCLGYVPRGRKKAIPRHIKTSLQQSVCRSFVSSLSQEKKGEKFRLRTPKKKATRRERGESEAVGSKSREKAAVPLLLIILSQYINIKASPALVPPSRE
jgi:hypothetical protein